MFYSYKLGHSTPIERVNKFCIHVAKNCVYDNFQRIYSVNFVSSVKTHGSSICKMRL